MKKIKGVKTMTKRAVIKECGEGAFLKITQSYPTVGIQDAIDIAEDFGCYEIDVKRLRQKPDETE